MSTRLWESKKYLTMLYIRQGKSPEDIAKQLGTTPRTIRNWLNKFNLLGKR